MNKELKIQDAINDDNPISFNMANNKTIHLATPIDANDAVNKPCVDTQTNNLLKTD